APPKPSAKVSALRGRCGDPRRELGWTNLGSASPLGLSYSDLANILYKDPNWDWRSFEVAKGIEDAAKADGGALFSGDPIQGARRHERRRQLPPAVPLELGQPRGCI